MGDVDPQTGLKKGGGEISRPLKSSPEIDSQWKFSPSPNGGFRLHSGNRPLGRPVGPPFIRLINYLRGALSTPPRANPTLLVLAGN